MTKPSKALAVWALLAGPKLAFAHSPIKGIDNFYNGLLHPVFVPAHALLLIALGLFLGQRELKENQMALAVFLVATVVGLIAAWFVNGDEKIMEIFVLSGAAIIGLMVASNLALGPYLCAFFAGLVGLLLGADSTQETLSDREKLFSLFGSGLGIFLLLLYAMGFADYFKKKAWQRIGKRVIGSWVAASALLVLALSFGPVSGN